MILDLPATLAILALGLAVFVFAVWRASRPPNPLKVRMINYHVVQIFSLVLLLIVAAHLATLLAGHPLAGSAP